AQIGHDLAEALAYAHRQGIVHRDVKPANIMLDTQGEAHLMDFGLAYGLEKGEQLTQEGAIIGTPAYMAPEHAQGKHGEALPASDQYSVGVVLYELLCGQTPFSGPAPIVLYNVVHREPESPRKRKPQVPRDLETICLKALAKRPKDRFATCQELAADLGRWLEGEPIRSRRLGRVERAVRWFRREPALALTGALAATCLVAVALVATVSAVRLRASAEREHEARQSADKHAIAEEANARQAHREAERARRAEEQANLLAEKSRRAELQART